METGSAYKQPETVRNDDTGVAGDAGNVHMPGIDDVKEKDMSTKCLTNDELEDSNRTAKFNTKDPQDRAAFYALIELRQRQNSIESLERQRAPRGAQGTKVTRREYMNYKGADTMH